MPAVARPAPPSPRCRGALALVALVVTAAAFQPAPASLAAAEQTSAGQSVPTRPADTHWCPMHPGVRAPGPGTCYICHMDLVLIPPPRVGEYAMDVNIDRRGASLRFELTIRDRATGEPVRDLETIHERLLHLFVISRSLETFVHVHPESRQDGAFVLDQVLKPGEYVLLADFLPSGGTPQMLHRAFVTPGYAGPLFAAAPRLEPTGADVVVDGVRVTFEGPQPHALRRSAMRFRVDDARTGAAIIDLEPYLGAPAHLLIVNPLLTDALHAHPEGEPSRGPELSFDPLFPEPGRYKMWLQIQRGGRVITFPFVIEVAPR